VSFENVDEYKGPLGGYQSVFSYVGGLLGGFGVFAAICSALPKNLN
jgi:hypothetical protein